MQPRRSSFSLVILFLAYLFSFWGCSSQPHPPSDENASGTDANQTTSLETGYPLDFCVVSGNDFGEHPEMIPYVHVYNGTPIKFCCKPCLPRFEKDPEMTGYAYGLHQRLVSEGIDPRTDQYYAEIDKAVRKTFPHKFDDGLIEEEAPQRQNGPVVAAPSKTTKKPRTVRLTSTQAALAKRLGLTNEQYAAQLMKEASK